MSDIFFECPECSQPLIVDEEGLGMHVDCPSCDTDLVVPEDAPLVEVEDELQDNESQLDEEIEIDDGVDVAEEIDDGVNDVEEFVGDWSNPSGTPPEYGVAVSGCRAERGGDRTPPPRRMGV